MVVPIFPNTKCSSEKRHPVRPTGSFPSSKCFHWADNVTNVRVRQRQNGKFFDDAHAVSLSGEQHVAIQLAFSDDYDRADELLSDDSTDSALSASGSVPSGTSSCSLPPDTLRNPKVLQACYPLDPLLYPLPSSVSTSSNDTQVSMPPLSNHSSVDRTASPSESGADSSRSGSGVDFDKDQRAIVKEISGLSLFGWDPDPAVPLIPLVDLWLELEEHICAEDIPSPVEWYKEEEQIVS